MELVYRVLWTDNQVTYFKLLSMPYWTEFAHEVISVADEESQIKEFRIKAHWQIEQP